MADVGDGRGLEKVHHAALPLAPDALHAAAPDQRAVGVVPRTVVERDGPLHGLDDVPERHFVRGPGEDVAAARAAAGANQPLVDQLLDDLLEELTRDALARRDL